MAANFPHHSPGSLWRNSCLFRSIAAFPGPVFEGVFVTSVGIPPTYVDRHKTIFAFFVGEFTQRINSPNSSATVGHRPLSQIANWENACENGIKFILDAQDDVPPKNSNGILLQMGRSSSGFTVYLVLVQSPLSGNGSVTAPLHYRRVGPGIHLHTQGRTEDEVIQVENRYTFVSTDRVLGLRQGETRHLYLV